MGTAKGDHNTFRDRLVNGSSGKEKKTPGEKGDDWVSSTWNRQEEREREGEANKNNPTSPLKLDDLLSSFKSLGC